MFFPPGGWLRFLCFWPSLELSAPCEHWPDQDHEAFLCVYIQACHFFPLCLFLLSLPPPRPPKSLVTAFEFCKSTPGWEIHIKQLSLLGYVWGTLQCQIPSSLGSWPSAVGPCFPISHWSAEIILDMEKMAGFLTRKPLAGEGRVCHAFFCPAFPPEKGMGKWVALAMVAATAVGTDHWASSWPPFFKL